MSHKSKSRVRVNERGNIVIELAPAKVRFGVELFTQNRATTQDSRAEMLRKRRKREKQRGWDD